MRRDRWRAAPRGNVREPTLRTLVASRLMGNENVGGGKPHLEARGGCAFMVGQAVEDGDRMVRRRLSVAVVAVAAVLALAGQVLAERWTEEDFNSKARLTRPYNMVSSTDPAVADTMI